MRRGFGDFRHAEKSAVSRLDRNMGPENAEQVQASRGVGAFFENSFDGWQARAANKEEGRRDRAGEGWEIKGAAIDRVISNEIGTPVMGVNVTGALGDGKQRRLVREMQSKPIIRVKGEGIETRNVPRVMVAAREEEVAPFLQGQTAEQNPEIAKRLLSGVISSLEFARGEVKNDLELQRNIDGVLETMRQKQSEIEEASRLAA